MPTASTVARQCDRVCTAHCAKTDRPSSRERTNEPSHGRNGDVSQCAIIRAADRICRQHCRPIGTIDGLRAAALPSPQDYDERVLPSIGNEVLKAIVAQYNADQLLTMREKV